MSNAILEFHVGRGGQFHNPGFVTYKGIVDGIGSTSTFDKVYPPEGIDIDDMEDGDEFVNEVGNSVGLTKAQYDSGDGIIDFDGGYDTTYTKLANDLSDEEAMLVFKDAMKFDGKYADLYLLQVITGASIADLKVAVDNNTLI